MAGRAEVRIVAGPEFSRVARALREIDATLPARLRKDIRDAVKPAVYKAQLRVRVLPVKGRGHTGLRARVARGVSIRVSTGLGKMASVRVVTSMADPREAMLPRGLDRPAGWRHPVFADREHWVVQHAMKPRWFMDPMRLNAPFVRNAIMDVLDKAAQEVARAGGTPH